jgi:hypothetical protein
VSKTRNLSDLLDANGDVKSTALDNVPASNDASALTTGTLPNARLSAVPNSALANSSITINGSATSLGGSATINTDLSNDTTPQLGGALDVNGHSISFGDDEKARFGNADDFEIYHNGTNNITLLHEKNTSNALHIRGDNIVLKSDVDNDDFVKCIENGAVEVYHSNSKKFETTSSGATVTGTLTATAFSGDGSALTNVPAGVSNVDMRIFSTSGTYTPTSGTKFFTVYATGGGGGGGHLQCFSNSRDLAGSGAGGGGTAVRTYNATEMGSSATITIGSGGSGASSSGGQGGTGGTTTFNPAGTGTTITGGGGTGAFGAYIASDVNGTLTGTGGHGGSGDVNLKGGDGMLGAISQEFGNAGNRTYMGGSGGFTVWGKGAERIYRTSTGSNNGNNGTYGGGGGGAVIRGVNNNNVGGSGGDGVVVILEYA